MVTASEMGRKGGSVKSEAKAEAARQNARKPRARKPMPDLSDSELLRLAALELHTAERLAVARGERYESLKINGHAIVDVIWHHLGLSRPK